MKARLLLPSLLLLLPVARARAQDAVALAERHERFGAVLGPATLPDGAMAFYAYVGAPDLVVGWRQGTSGFELEARARLDYLRLSTGVEGALRRSVWRGDSLELAPTLAVGVHAGTGSTYFDDDNFSALWLRLSPGLVTHYTVTETVRALGLVELPFDLALEPGGGRRFQALAGAGAEVYVGEDLSVLVLGQLGPDVLKEPLGVEQTRLGWGVRLGLGLRRF